MKKSVRTGLTLLLTLVFLFSITRFLLGQRDKTAGNSIYSDALALATSQNAEQVHTTPATEGTVASDEPKWVAAVPEEQDPHIQALADLNLDALREVNPDVVGWIMIPDTVISYPVMQGTDNDYYLKHTWDGKRYAVGSIFLEHLCSPDLADFNTIIYGHNMNNGSMFASLREYRNQEHWEKHPYVYIRSDEGVYRYEIFSSYLASVKSNAYGIEFVSDNTRNRFLTEITGNSVIDTGVTPEITDRVLTLSTCSGRSTASRWVVHARLKMTQVPPSEH